MSLLDLTFDHGTVLFNFEGHDLVAQAVLQPSTIRPGGKQAALTVSPSDTFGGDPGTRALFSYDVTQGQGEAWYGVQVQTPSEDGLLWELHQRKALYDHPQLVLAPFALQLHNGNLSVRTTTGDGTASGWPVWHPDDVLVTKPAAGSWHTVTLHALFSETGVGFVQWFYGSETAPRFSYTNIQTLPTYRAGGVTGQTLYLEQGFYRGWSASSTAHVTHGGSVRADTRAELQAFLGGGASPPPPVDKYAQVRAEMAYFKTGSPHIYAAFDELLKVLP